MNVTLSFKHWLCNLFSFFLISWGLFCLSAMSHLLYRKLYLRLLPVLHVFVNSNSVTVLNACMHRCLYPRAFLQAHSGVTEWSTGHWRKSSCLCLLLTAVPPSLCFVPFPFSLGPFTCHCWASPALGIGICVWSTVASCCYPWVSGVQVDMQYSLVNSIASQLLGAGTYTSWQGQW